jgi:hypothetical protein
VEEVAVELVLHSQQLLLHLVVEEVVVERITQEYLELLTYLQLRA